MTVLEPTDHQLLDFLCSVEANRHCSVRSVKTRLRPSLRRLRYAGLVWFDSYKPSASAIADWQARQSPPTPGGAAGEEPPRPKAADEEGGAVARLLSAPPIQKPARAMRDKAERFEKQKPSPPVEVVKVPPSTYRCGHPRTEENSASVGKGRGPVCRKCKREGQQRWREAAAERREFEPTHYAEADKADRTNARRGAAVRKATTARAMKRIEQGLDPRSCGQASVRHAQFALEKQLEISAKLADPIEQAKAALRKRYTPVLSAETTGGPAGHFYVGRKLVDQAELLAMAERLAA